MVIAYFHISPCDDKAIHIAFTIVPVSDKLTIRIEDTGSKDGGHGLMEPITLRREVNIVNDGVGLTLKDVEECK